MQNTEVKAVVLSSRDAGESDKLVTLFSLENGIIDAKLVGVKKQNAKLKIFKEPFCFAEFSFVKRGNFFIVSGSNLIDDFGEVSADVDVYFAACDMVKIIEKTSRKNEPSSEMFLEFLRALKAMAYDQILPSHVLLKFVLSTLNQMGYSPSFKSCISCSQKFIKAFFNVGSGEVICGDCKRALPLFETEVFEISKLALSAMHLTHGTEYARMHTLSLQKAGVDEAITLLKNSIIKKIQF